MTHLTMEQLLAIREPGLEPGVQGWRDHAAVCEVCQAELDRLDQRVARLRSLPALKPARNRFLEVRAKARAERRRKAFIAAGLGTLALAATVALAVLFTPLLRQSRPAPELAGNPELQEAMLRSRELEQALRVYDPEQRVIDGRTAAMAASIEDRLARVDRELQVVSLMDRRTRNAESLRLWRERVGLLDALVDVHVTRASYVGF
ncbi:MAG TPA: hypothetical protein VFN96_02260 [Gemmatimonadales bacterium]|nr:hypothetical protein [Gemmatimonadales bacterium]